MSAAKRIRVGDIDDATTNILAEWMNVSSDDDEEIAAGSDFEEEIDSLNSDTDQECDEETAVCQENEYYTGKDNSTKWSKQKPSSTVRTRAHNIIRDLPGPKAEAKEA
ncbi:hypothetical protein QE152_g17038 [Popillia japonica]|uniref:Uncharacterized protein n=1 Tax=Popillia japonica TaxID=7064 RepID=A0AAW1L570_POPJA